jgi:hypothetical protein
LVLVTTLLVTGGCLGSVGSSSIALSVREVDSAPVQAEVTPVDNDTVQQSPTLVNTISAVVNSNDSEVSKPLSSREKREIRRIVDALPTYEGEPGETGTYIRSEDTIVTVELLKKS